jgi:hypothetical protein
MTHLHRPPVPTPQGAKQRRKPSLPEGTACHHVSRALAEPCPSATPQMLGDPHTLSIEPGEVRELALTQPGPAAKERSELVIARSSNVPKLSDFNVRQVLGEHSGHVSALPSDAASQT